MIARLLALFAVLALALSPVNAAAAPGACAHMPEGGEIAAMPHLQASAEAMDVMLCCDPDPSSAMDPACVATCVAMAGVAADLPQAVAVKPRALARAPFVLARSGALPDRPPPRLERPPRPTA
ncbi:MAG: hypothetical protein Q8Q88_14230 [Phenylobacterium sp.]|nr:hypothetical protein [Phenylobacterium sp.]